MTDTAVVTARGLKKIFGRRPVLDRLDLTVELGEAIGLLGANGTGKTTLLKSLLGLLPVDAGHCAVLGEPSSSLSPNARARIAYVPQTPGQFPWLTGQAMLRYVSAFYPVFDWNYVRDLAARWKLARARYFELRLFERTIACTFRSRLNFDCPSALGQSVAEVGRLGAE
jgi:ABC-2 type transport system ATP-binding protein